jgi:hypothetical protein
VEVPISRYLRILAAAATDALGVDAGFVRAVADYFPRVLSTTRDCLPPGVSADGSFMLAKLLYYGVVGAVCGDVLAGRVGKAITTAHRSADPEFSARYTHFADLVGRLATEGMRYAQLPPQATGQFALYMAVKVTLAQSGLDDTNRLQLDQLVQLLVEEMQSWRLHVHSLRATVR